MNDNQITASMVAGGLLFLALTWAMVDRADERDHEKELATISAISMGCRP